MMENNDAENEAMETGIDKILGVAPPDPPTALDLVCRHVTDGFEEARDNINVTFKCLQCGELYKVPIKDLQ